MNIPIRTLAEVSAEMLAKRLGDIECTTVASIPAKFETCARMRNDDGLPLDLPIDDFKFRYLTPAVDTLARNIINRCGNAVMFSIPKSDGEWEGDSVVRDGVALRAVKIGVSELKLITHYSPVNAQHIV